MWKMLKRLMGRSALKQPSPPVTAPMLKVRQNTVPAPHLALMGAMSNPMSGNVEGDCYLVEDRAEEGCQFGMFGAGRINFHEAGSVTSEQTAQVFGSFDANMVMNTKSSSSFCYQGSLMLTTPEQDRIEMTLTSSAVESASEVPFPSDVRMRYRVTKTSSTGPFRHVQSAGHLKFATSPKSDGCGFNLSFYPSHVRRLEPKMAGA